MASRLWFVLAALLVAGSAAAQTSPSPGSSGAAADSSAPAPPPPVATNVTSTPPDFPRGKLSGLAFADYYWNAVGDPTHLYTGTSDQGKAFIDANGTPITRDLNGFVVRRLYFQLDNDLSIK